MSYRPYAPFAWHAWDGRADWHKETRAHGMESTGVEVGWETMLVEGKLDLDAQDAAAAAGNVYWTGIDLVVLAKTDAFETIVEGALSASVKLMKRQGSEVVLGRTIPLVSARRHH